MAEETIKIAYIGPKESKSWGKYFFRLDTNNEKTAELAIVDAMSAVTRFPEVFAPAQDCDDAKLIAAYESALERLEKSIKEESITKSAQHAEVPSPNAFPTRAEVNRGLVKLDEKLTAEIEDLRRSVEALCVDLGVNIAPKQESESEPEQRKRRGRKLKSD